MNHQIKMILLVSLCFAIRVHANDSDSANAKLEFKKIDFDSSGGKESIFSVNNNEYSIDTMKRIDPGLIHETGKYFGSIIAVSGFAWHISGFALSYYGFQTQKKTPLFIGLAGILFGIPLSGFASDLVVYNTYESNNAKDVIKQNWNEYKRGLVLTSLGIVCTAAGISAIRENDENTVALIILGPISLAFGLYYHENSLFRFMKSVFEAYNPVDNTNVSASFIVINGSSNGYLPGMQINIKF